MTSRNSEAVPSPVTQALDTSIIELQKSDQVRRISSREFFSA
jgi:hypothetical protein